MRRIPVLLFALVLLGCNPSSPPESESPEAAREQRASERLDAVLAARPQEFKARYQHRRPQETLQFFGIEPGMTVVEALPGYGWYSQLLVPYLGEDGRLIGANYAQEMWPKFGIFEQPFIDSMKTWTADWPKQAEAWKGEDGATVDAFVFGSMPAELEGEADAVLLIRALHNLARFEDEGGFLTTALDESFRVLKPGGIAGVVQHEARPDMPDEWAGGDKGYLKKQFVIDRMKEAGFELVDESGINQNPKDQPTEDEFVWRLPPSYMTSQDNPELRAEMDAIGESNRMTLTFRKPD
ncbi:MAG: class I SAM-dependent methyltransferase [Woeseiaceae bacterium]